jgi:hypothetical protein
MMVRCPMGDRVQVQHESTNSPQNSPIEEMSKERMADTHVAGSPKRSEAKRFVAESSEGDETKSRDQTDMLCIHPFPCIPSISHRRVPSPPLPHHNVPPRNFVVSRRGDRKLAGWKHLGTTKLGLSSGKVRHATIHPAVKRSNIVYFKYWDRGQTRRRGATLEGYQNPRILPESRTVSTGTFLPHRDFPCKGPASSSSLESLQQVCPSRLGASVVLEMETGVVKS